jgi:hypothetical protein
MEDILVTDTDTDAQTDSTDHPERGHFKVNETEIRTTADRLTGEEIKALAIAEQAPGVELTDLLELRKDGKKIPIADNESVVIEDGLQFRTYPGGKDS